jgi:hypothetical protein
LVESLKVAIVRKRHTIHTYSSARFCWTVGMTENQEVPGRKGRSSEEIKRLVLEFDFYYDRVIELAPQIVINAVS